MRDPDCDEILREACVEEIGELRLREALPKLTHALSHAHGNGIRTLWAEACGKIGSYESIEKLKEEALTSNDLKIFDACIEAISTIGSQLAVSTLSYMVSELQQRNERYSAQSALLALATIPTETSLHFLIQMFRNKEQEMRQNISNQLQPILKYDQKCLLEKIQTLSLQLHRIVSPKSLGLSDVTSPKE